MYDEDLFREELEDTEVPEEDSVSTKLFDQILQELGCNKERLDKGIEKTAVSTTPELISNYDTLLRALGKEPGSQLSLREIGTALQNPAIRGENAATLAIISRIRDGMGGTSVGPETIGRYLDISRRAAESNLSINRLYDQLNSLYRTDFASLNPGGNGPVTRTTVETAMRNAAGDRQEALRFILRNWSNITYSDTLHRTSLNVYAETVRGAATAESDINMINDRRERLRTASRALYADSEDALNSIKPDAISQGTTENCMFLSSVASLAHSNPRAIRDMITPDGPGRYRVQFPGERESVTVTAPTDAELLLFTGPNPRGIWPYVLERAEAAVSQRKMPGDAGGMHPIDANNGGSDGTLLLTGQSMAQQQIANMSNTELTNWLNQSVRDGVPIIAIAARQGNAPAIDLQLARAYRFHAYSIIGFDGTNITLRDPRGNVEPLDGEGKPLNDAENGTVTMSLAEFRSTFQHVGRPRR